jgi:hypothetical protein
MFARSLIWPPTAASRRDLPQTYDGRGITRREVENDRLDKPEPRSSNAVLSHGRSIGWVEEQPNATCNSVAARCNTGSKGLVCAKNATHGTEPGASFGVRRHQRTRGLATGNRAGRVALMFRGEAGQNTGSAPLRLPCIEHGAV